MFLDRFIRGINLAIYIRTEDKTFEHSIAELLDYYDQRGNLVTWNITKKPDNHMTRKLWHDVLSNIKQS